MIKFNGLEFNGLGRNSQKNPGSPKLRDVIKFKQIIQYIENLVHLLYETPIQKVLHKIGEQCLRGAAWKNTKHSPWNVSPYF